MFNPFQENTYVAFDETKQAIIIDPGCYSSAELNRLFEFIGSKTLQPTAIVNTHCHIDHVFGVNAVRQKYDIPFYCHKGELPVLQAVPAYAPVYGMEVDPIENVHFLEEDTYSFGNTELVLKFTPGHSPASLCFIHQPSKQIIAGDVLFQGSIGRADLPGGDYTTLMKSIENELLPLDDDYRVYPGHGEPTTIGIERRSNPFILEWLANK